METNRISQAAWIAIVAIIVSKRGKATLDIKPTDAAVLLNGSTFFNCSTFNFSSNSEEIAWYHSTGNNPRKDVYEDGEILANYAGRFRVEMDLSKGVVNLIVEAVTLEDAGTYECQDGKGVGETARAQLTVLESVPTCTSTKNPIELIGPNNCNKKQENLTLTCSVAYRGNNPPLLEWRMAGANDTVTQRVTVERLDNRITSHLTMSSQHSMDGSSFICQTTEMKYNCTSDVVNVIYVISNKFTQKAVIGETVVCAANTSESCSYRWKWFKGDDTLTASNSQTLIPKQSGNFRCEADCIIRNEPCMITAMFAYVEDDNATSTTGETSGAWLMAVVVVTSIIIAAAIISIIVFVLRARNKNLAKRTQHIDNATERVPLQDSSAIKSNATDDDTIQKACTDRFIYKGLNDSIFGPGEYKGLQCVCEKILVTKEQQEKRNEDGKTAVDIICTNSGKWKKLTHPNLIKIHEVIVRPSVVYIVTEYASVEQVLQGRTIGLREAMNWATQIAKGLEHLHANGIIHKNIKSAQIFVLDEIEGPSETKKITVKIGCTNFLDDGSTNDRSSSKQNKIYQAPEVIEGGKHSKKSDVWSFSVVVWELLPGKSPANVDTADDITRDLKSNRNLSSKQLIEILLNCRNNTPASRPSFSTIVKRLQQCEQMA